MKNLFSYSPKYLTTKQTTKLDQLVVINLREYYDARCKQSFFGAISAYLGKTFNQLIEKNSDTQIKTMGLSINNVASFLVIKFIALLGFKQSPKQLWIFKQTHRIREEVDMMMSSLPLHKSIPIEKLIEKVNAKIDNLTILKNTIRKNSPISIFTDKVKIAFLSELKDEYSDLSISEKSKEDRVNNNDGIGTSRQQTRMIYYFLEHAQLNKDKSIVQVVDYTNLIHFLTGRSKENIPKYLKMSKNEQTYIDTLLAIKPHFEAIKAHEIVAMIDRDMRG